MSAQRPLTRISGRTKEIPVGDVLTGLGLLGMRVSISFFTGAGTTPTWTKRAGLAKVWVIGIGNGGSSGGAINASGRGGGGGQGEMGWSEIAAASLGSTETVTLGALGSTGTGNGGAAGDCSFGSHVVLKPGAPGNGGNGGSGNGGNGGSGGTYQQGTIGHNGAAGAVGGNARGEGGGGIWNLAATTVGNTTQEPTAPLLAQILCGNRTTGLDAAASANGRAGGNYGSGAAGAARTSTGSQTGAQGGPGAFLVVEFYDD